MFSELWINKLFYGSQYFRSLSREKFKRIRSKWSLYPTFYHYFALCDQLWHSSIVIEHLCLNCSSVTAPIGATSFDENTICCKGRTSEINYIKSKPLKLSIRLYENFGWKYGYRYFIWNNGSGNKTGVPPPLHIPRVLKNTGDL